MHAKKREKRWHSSSTQKGVVALHDQVLFLTIFFHLATWFIPVCLNLAATIKQSPNVKCLINTSCHQEQLCLKWFFLTSLGPIRSFLYFQTTNLSETRFSLPFCILSFPFIPTKGVYYRRWPDPLLVVFTSLTQACCPHFGINLNLRHRLRHRLSKCHHQE